MKKFEPGVVKLTGGLLYKSRERDLTTKTGEEAPTMLMRTDPFRELDRFAQQVLGTAARPAVMPMDAWREGEQFVVEFDLPGIDTDSLDIDIERNVVTVRAERPSVDPVEAK